jgi:Tfp pilus assembly ATPase PilU
MQTFDQSLMSLFREKMISYDEAVLNSSRPDDFALRVKGIDTRRTDAETFLTGGFEDYDDSFSTRG